jgi:hypothetical protein
LITGRLCEGRPVRDSSPGRDSPFEDEGVR